MPESRVGVTSRRDIIPECLFVHNLGSCGLANITSPQNHSVNFARADAITTAMFVINSGCENVLQLLRYLVATKVVWDLLYLFI